MVLAPVKDKFLPTELSTHVDDAESSDGRESQAKPQEDRATI